MKKAQSGSHRKCDTARHKKPQKRHRDKRREIREQQAAAQEMERIHDEAEFAQRLPDIHVPEVKNEEDSRSTGNNLCGSGGSR